MFPHARLAVAARGCVLRLAAEVFPYLRLFFEVDLYYFTIMCREFIYPIKNCSLLGCDRANYMAINNTISNILYMIETTII